MAEIGSGMKKDKADDRWRLFCQGLSRRKAVQLRRDLQAVIDDPATTPARRARIRIQLYELEDARRTTPKRSTKQPKPSEPVWRAGNSTGSGLDKFLLGAQSESAAPVEPKSSPGELNQTVEPLAKPEPPICVDPRDPGFDTNCVQCCSSFNKACVACRASAESFFGRQIPCTSCRRACAKHCTCSEKPTPIDPRKRQIF